MVGSECDIKNGAKDLYVGTILYLEHSGACKNLDAIKQYQITHINPLQLLNVIQYN